MRRLALLAILALSPLAHADPTTPVIITVTGAIQLQAGWDYNLVCNQSGCTMQALPALIQLVPIAPPAPPAAAPALPIATPQPVVRSMSLAEIRMPRWDVRMSRPV